MATFDIYKAAFPALSEADFVLTSPQTHTYNCIAHAAGDPSRWWWPDPFQNYYWPPEAFRLENLPAFQQAFGTIGYELCGDGNHEMGYEKIAIYHKDNVPTHGARQLEDGSWTSKLGAKHDISHGVSCLDGAVYGTVAFFMRRKIAT